jgi:hypothetical protein
MGDQTQALTKKMWADGKYYFDEYGEVNVKRMGNVFIVLPKMSLNTFAQCSPTQIPLQSIVSLGAIKKEGRYLVHVRSTTGRSVNKVFTVKASPFDNVGRHHTRREID